MEDTDLHGRNASGGVSRKHSQLRGTMMDGPSLINGDYARFRPLIF